MDALSSFAFLTDHLPLWMSDANTLNSHTTRKQKEFAAEFSRLAKTQHPRSKHSSTKSLGSKEDHQLSDIAPKATGDVNPPQHTPLELASNQVFGTARRKRKVETNSAHSRASGTQRYRTRPMVVVWYDSDVQEGFENLVRNIAGARNNLRKGRMSAAMKNGFQLPSLRSTPSTAQNIMSALPDVDSGLRSTILMPGAKPSATQTPPGNLSENAFDKADKELEGAQMLCEKAAHQFLRDGDCQLELQGIKQRFEAALAIGKLERGKLEREKLEEERMNEELEQVGDVIKEEDSLSNGNVVDVSLPKPLHPVAMDPTSIEVDDNSDAESIEIDISAFRAARMGRTRA